MKIAVRYQSRGGNTKAVAEVITNSLGVKAETVNSAISEYVDVLFVGGGVYMSKPDKSLCNFWSELNKDSVGQIVCFSTSGTMDSAIKQIKKIAINRGMSVNENNLRLNDV